MGDCYSLPYFLWNPCKVLYKLQEEKGSKLHKKLIKCLAGFTEFLE